MNDKHCEAYLVDSHCHLDFADFDQDRTQILARCHTLNIKKLVVPGTQSIHWPRILQFAEDNPAICPALGLHPYFLNSMTSQDPKLLISLLEQYRHKIVALGEIGLDFVIDIEREHQIRVFVQQLNIARDLHLPVILHHRKSHNELLRQIKRQGFTQGGIVHAFSGSLQDAQQYIDLGFKLGIGGVITYQRAIKTRQVVRQLPLTSMVLETDAPDMPPAGKQGERNSPENLLLVLEHLLSLRTESSEQIIRQCTANTVAALVNMQD